MKFNIIDHTGAQAEVDVNLQLMGEAKAAGAVHPLAHLDNKIQTSAEQPTARQQVYAQMGLLRKGLKLQEAMDAVYAPASAGPAVDDGLITGRLVTQAYLFDAIESKLRESDYGIMGIFNRKAAAVDTINNTKFDRPILNYTRPEGARSRNVAQLSEPASMLLLTVSDTSYKIPGTSIGLEYSDEAAKQVSMDIVTMSVTRQGEVEAQERIEQQLLAFLNGDADYGISALSAVTGAVKNAKTDFDSTISTAGTLTQKAWVNWLFYGSRKRQVNTVITDLAGALAIENRSGRPTVQTDNATSKRIDTGMTVLNPTWPDQVDIIISQDPNWPANTLVGFDSRYGYHVVNSSSLSYTAYEQFAIRRSTKWRMDTGSMSYRLFDDAWQVLTLTV